MSSSTTTASGSSPSESKTDSSTEPQSLAISEHSSLKGTPSDIGEWLTSSVGASPASPSQSLESKPLPMTREICGPPPLRSFASLDPDTRSWKTSQVSLLSLMRISEPSCKDWPKSGTMRNGACYRLRIAAPPIGESGCGLSQVPTPNKTIISETPEHLAERKENFKKGLSKFDPGVKLEVWVQMYPTPTAQSYGSNQGGSAGRTGKGRPSLGTMAKMGTWPTPMGRDWRTATGKENRHSPNLNVMVKRWPTPRASEPAHPGRMKANHTGQTGLTEAAVGSAGGGQLNPTWVEWLMGWIPGWTDLKPLGTDKFQSWLRLHGGF